jgi:hypothetical protein
MPDTPKVSALRPADDMVDVSTSVALSWSASDPDPNDKLRFTVVFSGSNPPQTVIAHDMEAPSVRLTDLAEQAEYFWQVTVTDATGLTATGPVWSFSTSTDETPPRVLRKVTVAGVTHTEANVQWRSNDPTTGVVQVASSPDLAGARDIESATLATDHQVLLADLLAGSIYYVQVMLTDKAGNTTTAKTRSFTTLNAPDLLSPEITNGPVAIGISHTQAGIDWRTDESATSLVRYSLLAADLATGLEVTDDR